MNFTDTHCHLYKEYYDDIATIINNAKMNNIKRFINNGVDLDTNKEVIALASKFEEVYATIGIHPENVDKYTESDIEFIKENINNDKVIAIGEIGLDYHYTESNKKEQKALLELQLKIAEDNNLPVVIHSRDSMEDTLAILKKYNTKGVIHSFSGTLKDAEEFIKLGYLIGINGVVTFKNSNLKEILQDIKLENIILETDSPYLSPVPKRGTQNSPENIMIIAEFICKIKNVTLSDLSKQTEDNIYRLFKI